MFYYYEKAGKLLASERRDLPLSQGGARPGDSDLLSGGGGPGAGPGLLQGELSGPAEGPPTAWRCWTPPACRTFPWTRPCPPPWRRGCSLPSIPAGRGGSRCCPRGLGRRKKRVNILAIGDVGSTLLTGLKLLGGDVISSIGICDLSDQITARWEFEMGQISLPWDYRAFPEVEVISLEKLFDCDVFVFVASRGIPPVGSQVKDVRMAQFENNAAIVKQYARMARAADFQGLWCAVSDPVDPLAKTAYLESNRDENGVWDGKGLRPEQIQGFGLGVMNARAAYFAKRDPRLASFLTEGRSFGPHGTGLFIANSIDHYDEGGLPGADPQDGHRQSGHAGDRL